jgi:hypothetical protein
MSITTLPCALPDTCVEQHGSESTARERNAKRATAFRRSPRKSLNAHPVFGERHLRHLLNSYQKYYNKRLARTYTRTHRSHVPSRLSVARWRCQFWADCITNISGPKFLTGQRSKYLFIRELVGLDSSEPSSRQLESPRLRPARIIPLGAENAAVPRLNVLSLRLHRLWIAFYQLDGGERPPPWLLLHEPME